ncbi:MAG TPA: aminotransferase DegT [Acidobacteria bacterium]|nr:aminotransferase DegT [Acidobacteriota bacterium]
MIPRKRLDIGWIDVAHGIAASLAPPRREAVETVLREVAPGGDHRLACLSVRSGFDALLTVLDYPPGSEVLVSAITIRDMVRIVEAHGLVPVPVDLDPRSLQVRPESLQRAIGPRSRAVLVAHLFGSRMPLEPVLDVARAHGLFVVEDGAQAFASLDALAPPQADVSLWSFGPIKTTTALAGGLLCFRDPRLLEQVRRHQDGWPERSRWSFLFRLLKYSVLMALTWPPLYTLFVALCRLAGKSHDAVISANTRGFPGDGFLQQIRHRPSTPLLALLARRLQRFDPAAIAARTAAAEQAMAAMPFLERPGDRAARHTHWVFPILNENPVALVNTLWKQGFDATRGASSLHVVGPPADRPELAPVEAERTMERLLYLPVYPEVPQRTAGRLATALAKIAANLA